MGVGVGVGRGSQSPGLGVSFPDPELGVRGCSGFTGLARRARPRPWAAGHVCPPCRGRCLPWGGPQVSQSRCGATTCSSQAAGTQIQGAGQG